MSPIEKTKERLQKHIRREHRGYKSACWIWTASKDKDTNYSRIKFQGVNCYAHRVSYFVFVGDIDKDLVIMHLCDQQDCVNPAHLRQSTQGENIRYKYREEKFYGNGKALKRQVKLF